jgi:cadmium resistance protein CadD (predicted permease)
MVATVIAAFLAFVSTNLDDLFLLLVLCGQRQGFRTVLIGQYIGFGAIILTSVVVSVGASFLRPEWVGFFGLAPFAIGVNGLPYRRRRDEHTRPLGNTVGVLSIAIVTFSNGGDNIAVYAPLFAGRAPVHVATMISVFLVMVPIWCWLALRLARLPLVATRLDRWGQWIAPLVLMGLGIYLFVDAGGLALVTSRAPPR